MLYAVVMVAYSPLLAAIGIASVVINLGMARLISAKRVNVTRVQMRDAGKLAAATVSGIEMVETIKAAGAEGGYSSAGPASRQVSTRNRSVSRAWGSDWAGAPSWSCR